MFKYSVIMAGGRGDRMRPLTEYVPKALVNYQGIPLISRVIEQHRKFSKNIFVTVGYKRNMLVKYLMEEEGIYNFIDLFKRIIFK